MSEKDISEINIIYEINIKHNDYINIFRSVFVNNNKNKCKMIIDNKNYEIVKKYNIKNYNNNIIFISFKDSLNYMIFSNSPHNFINPLKHLYIIIIFFFN